ASRRGGLRSCETRPSRRADRAPGRCRASWGSLLGGKDPTGRFLLVSSEWPGITTHHSLLTTHQSEPNTSPPDGVTAAHHVEPLILGLSVRTLPSARTTCMPPGCAVEVRIGSQFPKNGVGWTWNFDPGPMDCGAPRAARAGIANPGWYAFPGKTMGGGNHAKARAVQYAHAVPPSENAGRLGFEQRAYFSAMRMVFERPSMISDRGIFPWGVSTTAVEFRTASRALPA